MRIAIVGAGISGLTAAYYLQHDHQLCVYESADKIGGHTATVDVECQGRDIAIDTGFIVYNDWTYPNFIHLLEELGVASKPTEMSFSVSCESSGLEYAGSNLNALFAQRSNLLRPTFWRMLKDILRFNRESVDDLEQHRIDSEMTLGDYLRANNYSQAFITHYLVPMGAAIWSAGMGSMLDFPLQFFIRFFKNHGLLSIRDRPQWRVIEGGSRQYLAPLTRGFSRNIKTGARITDIRREHDRVLISSNGATEEYDALIFATHSDQALKLLTEPTTAERDILGAIPYQENEVVLHTDTQLLPHRQRAWSSWNYRLPKMRRDSAGLEPAKHLRGDAADRYLCEPVSRLTYNMNILQQLNAPETYCVSLNQTESIRSAKIIDRFSYSHPVFSLAGMDAQSRWSEIAGANRTWYCGAYWHNGFHEDGVNSALRVVKSIEALAESRVDMQRNNDVSRAQHSAGMTEVSYA